MIPIKMPQVGQDIPSGTIVEWLKQEDDPVEEGEVVLTVESDKAVFEVEAEGSGILLKILHPAGDEVEILRPVGLIGQPGETAAAEAAASVEEKTAGEETVREAAPEKPASKEPTEKLFVSPVAKRVARELGVDLARVKGTGPRGRITKEDVMAAAEAAKAGAAPAETVAEGDRAIVFGKTRKRIAERLTLSIQTIPHFFLTVDADVTELLRWRKEANEAGRVHVSVTDLIIRATARALTEFELMNSHVGADKMVVKGDVNVGVAVSTDQGLLVPVIAGADEKSLGDIAAESRKNAEAARRGSINPNIVGTFTISSLGMFAIKTYQPIINPPEAAILAVGTAENRLVYVDGKPEGRDMMSMTLACDHRAVDGAYAAEFLNRIKHYLENCPGETGLWDV